jgi:hypothetical protein
MRQSVNREWNRGSQPWQSVRGPGELVLSCGSVLFQNDAHHVACVLVSAVGDGFSHSNAAPGGRVLRRGGAFVASGSATISESTFTGNQALGGSPGASAGGGSLSNSSNTPGATMTVTGCTLSGNAAIGEAGGDDMINFSSGQGGGFNDFDNLTVVNSTLIGNQAVGTPLAPGAAPSQTPNRGSTPMRMNRGDVALVDYPFATGGAKVRPAPVAQNVSWDRSRPLRWLRSITASRSRLVSREPTPSAGDVGDSLYTYCATTFDRASDPRPESQPSRSRTRMAFLTEGVRRLSTAVVQSQEARSRNYRPVTTTPNRECDRPPSARASSVSPGFPTAGGSPAASSVRSARGQAVKPLARSE